MHEGYGGLRARVKQCQAHPLPKQVHPGSTAGPKAVGGFVIHSSKADRDSVGHCSKSLPTQEEAG